MHPYSIFHPKKEQNGILFNSPHSGTYLPEDFLGQISIDPDLLHFSGDILVDRLIRNIPLSGATGFICHYARAYVDTNRSCREIDPDMFHGQNKENNFERTGKVARGFGIISRKSYDSQAIYAGKLPASEINHRLSLVYHPVHEALKNLLKQLHQKHGFSLLLDCHSMPSYDFINHFTHSDQIQAKQPDLIIGNCFGDSCREDLSQHVADFFTNHGLKVTFNVPYAGGFNTRYYGKPGNNRHALQLEFNRALYMDEKTLKPNEGFPSVQALLTGLGENLNENLRDFFSKRLSL